MTRVLRTIPTEGQQLCEGCGYVLTGLPDSSHCPECGLDPAESSPDLRQLPPWEDPADPRPETLRFLVTSCSVLLRPRHFYRHLATRHPGRGYAFAVVHWLLSSLLLGTAVYFHLRWFTEFFSVHKYNQAIYLPILIAGIYYSFELTTALAARLTHWEATYRGLRLPMPVVLRSMHYHAAHYVPVCALALATVLTYRYLLVSGRASALSGPTYLYALCALVVVGAFYLFKTYWTAMRNVMYATR